MPMFSFFKSKPKNQEESVLSLIPKGWLVREIAQDPVTGLWMGILFNIEPALGGGCYYVEATEVNSFTNLIGILVNRIETKKHIKNSANFSE